MGVGRLTPGVSKAVSGTAATATAGSTAATPVDPPTPSEDTWVKLNVAGPESFNTTGPGTPQHYDAVGIDSTGEIWCAWWWPVNPADGVTPAGGGTFLWSPTLKYWVRTNALGEDRYPWDGDKRVGVYTNNIGMNENYGACYDYDSHSVWVGISSPDGGGNWGYSGDNHPWAGDRQYKIAEARYYLYAPKNSNIEFGRTDIDAVLGGNSNNQYYNGALWSHPSDGTLKRRRLSVDSTELNLADKTALASNLMGPPQYHNFPNIAGLNKTSGYLWFIDIRADFCYVDIRGEPPYTWVKVTTTGSKPPYHEGFSDLGQQDWQIAASCALHEERNLLIAHISGDVVNAPTRTVVTSYNTTWVLDLTTYVWRMGPSRLYNNDLTPLGDSPAQSAAAANLSAVYDRFGKRILMVAVRRSPAVVTEVWEFKPRYTAQWTAVPLPVEGPGGYGVNYGGFPFTWDGDSKNVCAAENPVNGRIYFSGGDTYGSDTPGIWSVDLATGTNWRLDSGYPNVYNPTIGSSAWDLNPWPYPQPNGYQDNTGMWWRGIGNHILFGYTISQSYETQGVTPNWIYARGIWFFDPTKYPDPNAWTQDLNLRFDYRGDFSALDPYPIHRPQSGCSFGGYYDPATDSVYVFDYNASTSGTQRVGIYNVATMTRTLSPTYSIPLAPGLGPSQSRYYGGNGPIAVGRDLYQLGFNTDGVSSYFQLLRWNIDTQTLVGIYQFPPAYQAQLRSGPHKLETSNGKVVYLNHGYPQGDLTNIFLFDPATLAWSEDLSRPTQLSTFGVVLCSTHCSLADGRIVMAGQGSGSLGGHRYLYFYRAP